MKPADYKAISYVRIHPGIGISRVGNGSGYFYAPEVPHPMPPAPEGYKDAQGFINRQAQRFRIYGYDKEDRVIGEVTAGTAEITWTAHLANKKAAWYCFNYALDLPQAAKSQTTRRNAQFRGGQRSALEIKPRPESISGRDKGPIPLRGWFVREDYAVELGELRTDARGRLVVLGGKGKSGTPFLGNSVTTFANNDGWHDDTSDGPVTATVKLPDGRILDADPAWLVVAPPNYAPDIVTVQTTCDVMYDALAGTWAALPAQVSFTEHIQPIFEQLCAGQWVNEGFLALFGWDAPNNFAREDFMQRLAGLDEGQDASHAAFRRQVFKFFRDPSAQDQQPSQWPPIYGDAYYSFPSGPHIALALTQTRYNFLTAWANGEFLADYDADAPPPRPFDKLQERDRPAALDRAALHFCMGGPFHPGCEMTWPMRHASMYRNMFRIRMRPADVPEPDYGDVLTAAAATADGGPLTGSGPGDITRWMAVPWQTDTASCLSGYDAPDNNLPSFWPARVPNDVLTEEQYKIIVKAKTDSQRIAAFNTRVKFLRSLHLGDPYIVQLNRMLEHFGKLGVVVRMEQDVTPSLPPELYVEQKMIAPVPPGAPVDAQTPVHPDYSRARFGKGRGGKAG